MNTMPNPHLRPSTKPLFSGAAFIVLIAFLTPQMGRADCNSDAAAQEDRENFNKDLKVIKGRVAGFESHMQEKKQAEAQRLAGISAQRQSRLQDERRRDLGRVEFHRERVETLRQRRRAMVAAWRVYAAGERAQHERVECARRTFVRERAKFEQAKRDILNRDEERELNIYSR
jgi:hypothetical protein